MMADGIAVQAVTGVTLAVGGGGDFSATQVEASNPPIVAFKSAAGASSLGGSGRNVLASGPSGLSGYFRPTIPGSFERGALTLVVTGPSAAVISDGGGNVAILSSGGTAPIGSYASTTHGADDYNSGAAFVLTMTAEEGGAGAIPDALVSVSAGRAIGGVYHATDAANFVSADDADWTMVLDPSGTAEIRYKTDLVAARATGSGYDPSGLYAADVDAYFYNPVALGSPESGMRADTNPFGVLTLVFSWPATPDLDIAVSFLADRMGWNQLNVGTYMTWSGDDQNPAGSETVAVDLAAAWTAGDIDTFADVRCAADWYPPKSGSGPATLAISYSLGGYSETLAILPASVTPAASLVQALRVLADGSVALAAAPWQCHVTQIARVPRAGFVYLEVITVGGLLDAINGPFFATALPSNAGETTYFPVAKCDGTTVEQYHTGALVWPSPATQYVDLTGAEYDALTGPERADSSKVYNVTDFVWPA